MSETSAISPGEIDRAYEKYKKDAIAGGYNINPDVVFTKNLIEGLLVNQSRYGYPSCPCRLSMGNKEDDLDIICPCDYRDRDVVDNGACYCALYISQAVLEGKQTLQSIPESRPPRSERKRKAARAIDLNWNKLPLPVWRCKVCGYLCARDGPPEVCPVCKAKKERFERFI
ncbi:MAG: ferredoxin:glutaredoxin reductase [Chloroflexi bacterium]|nr:ferredoxin:glutaredoxin reductase [Chloroflexota bacterium]